MMRVKSERVIKRQHMDELKNMRSKIDITERM